MEGKREKSGRKSTKFKIAHQTTTSDLKRFVVKAVGIPTISDDIPGIQTKEMQNRWD